MSSSLWIAVATAPERVFWAVLTKVHALRARSPVVGECLRKLVLLLWWTVSFQLHTHCRFWLRNRMRARRTNTAPAVPIPLQTVDPATLRLPSSDRPLVSIVIPVHGKLDYTLRCLASIAACPSVAPFEVLVFDDAGPPDERRALSRVQGIDLLWSEVNLGFIGACNTAARTARGAYLLFLNNDTQVMPGWLDAMLALFDTHTDAGAVGARLLFPDGRLQEAGCIIWRDGTGWNVGRDDDPDRPAYNHVREVDYCSGAALLTPTTLFRRVEGFDTRYAPAYFEDADYCFKLRRNGWKTYYQPNACVIHFEGVSHGQDLSIGVKAYQTSNRRVFVQAWHATLAADHYRNGEQVQRARDRARHRKIVLVIDHMIPRPDRDAGSRTMVAFLRALLDAGHVVKFWPHNMLGTPGYTRRLQDWGIEVFHGPGHPTLSAWLKDNGAAIDHVLLCRPDVAEACLPAIRRHTGARVAYYGHDLHFARMRAQGELNRDETMLRAADRMEERERAIWLSVDTVLYPSASEASVVTEMDPSARAHAVQPYAFDTFAPPRAPSAGRDILFVAGFGHPPNEDALRWYLTHIHPLVLSHVPDTRLRVIGSDPTAWVRAQAGASVIVDGDVDDATLAAAYASARVSVVPLRAGAGVKMKTVEALKEGLPVVVTPVGAQGLPDLDWIVPVRHDPIGFAAAVCVLLLDDPAWQHANTEQLRYARAHFDRAGLGRSLLRGMGLIVETPVDTPVALAAE